MIIDSRPLAAARSSVAAALVFAAACGGDGGTAPAPPSDAPLAFNAPPAVAPDLPGRGELLEATPLLVVPRQQVAVVIAATGASGAFTARFDAQLVRIRYRTPDPTGQLVAASGAIWLPVTTSPTLPLVTYLHGTVYERNDVPSNPASAEGGQIGPVYASDGNVTVMPDYLGLGLGQGYHPWQHQATQASASVDALRAARAYATQRGITLARGSLFITGYSQGGGAAMALHRELERSFGNEFPVLGSAPMAGAYDLSGTVRGLLTDDPAYPPSVNYATFLMASFVNVYGLTPQLRNVLVPPHDATGAALINGSATGSQLDALPSRPTQVLQPAVLAGLRGTDVQYPAWRAIRDNDVIDWRPTAPMRMYYGGADRDVPPQNALTAQTRLRANGATDVAAVNVGALLDHGTAVIPSLIAGKRFLDSLRARPQ